MDRSEELQGWSLHPAVLSLLFLLGLAATLPDHLLFHPDERHYVDGGMMMVQTGDWLTPRTSDGEVRLRKPILPYWFAAAGTALFGASPWSTRLPFLLAGCGMIWATWAAAKQAHGSTRAATFAALIVMCHPAVLLSSTRSLPDIVLSFFLAVSLVGFLGILSRCRADWSLLALAYGGGACAILSKGAPALVFVAFASLIIFWKRRVLVEGAWQRFALAAGLCAVTSSSWFVAMHVMHGSVLQEQFLADQAGEMRFAPSAATIARHAILIVLVLLGSFAATLLPAGQTFLRRARELVAIADRPAYHLLLGWTVLFLAAAACINHVSLRYLLPVVVPVSILLGNLLAELDGPALRIGVRRMAWLSLACLPVGAVLFIALHVRTHPVQTALVTLATAAAGYRLWSEMRKTSTLRAAVVSTASLHLVLAIVAFTGHNLLGRSFGYQVHEVLRAHGAADRPLILIGEAAHATRARVCSGGLLMVNRRPRAEAPEQAGTAAIAAIDPDALPPESEGVRHVHVPCGFDGVRVSEALRALAHGELDDYLRLRSRSYTLALPTNRPEQHVPTDVIHVAEGDATSEVR